MTPEHEKARPIRRFIARIIDICVAWTAFIWAARVLSPTLSERSTIALSMMATAAWVPVEAILISVWHATPGKWLLTSRIEAADGGRVTYWKALDRSLTVWIWGLGCFIPGVYIVCLAVAYQDLSNCGTSRWDRGKFRVVHAPVGPPRYAIAILVLLVLLILDAAVKIW